MEKIQIGKFYKNLVKKRNDPEDLQRCVIETVEKLKENETTLSRPGMLLGKIQSGKTKAFIGIIALGFDNGYDISIVLTKGTRALAEQTYQRLASDFSDFIENDDLILGDIMHLPDNLTKYELQQKIVIVVKKETNNMKRIIKALEETYPDLKEKSLLIIDDEADFASIGFKRSKEEGIEMNKISQQIDGLRREVKETDFLQVTATPYSLYLQPKDLEINEVNLAPIKPIFTVLLPIHSNYIGGEYYFPEETITETLATFVYEEVLPDEVEVLKSEDRRSFKIEDALTSKRINKLRNAIVDSITGSSIRRIQQRKQNIREEKYSFIIHTEQRKASHVWQKNIALAVKEQLIASVESNKYLLNNLIKDSYDDLSRSIKLLGTHLPTIDEVRNEVYKSLTEGYVMTTVVNSEGDIKELLDEKGQLKLRTPLNIFIGGQILDRGITIRNLIGFYYGRRPKRFQQDTVLQHSRMFGFRPKEDLAVTRFYTTLGIYQVMRRIHEFDTALRSAFENGAQEDVVFIHKDITNKVVPCSPNKVLASSTTTLKPFKRLLPVGFQTDYKSKIKIDIDNLDLLINDLYVDEKPFLLDLYLAKNTINLISKTLIFEEDYDWDIDAFNASMEYLSKNTDDLTVKGKIWCLVRTNRNLSRTKLDGSFSNQPDNPETDLPLAKELAVSVPILMLFRQNGKEKDGWRDSPFWWPVLMVPKNAKTVIFSNETEEDDEHLVEA